MRIAFLTIALTACGGLEDPSEQLMDGKPTWDEQEDDNDGTNGNGSGESDADTDADVDSDVDSDTDSDTDPVDNDGDGYDSEQSGGDDCDDNDDLIHPGMTELWDIRDNDCDGSQDEDGRLRLYRYFKDHNNVVADIDGDGSYESYRDYEHQYDTSKPGAGWVKDGYWMEIYPTDLCTDSTYKPQDGCSENSDRTVDLWGGAYALIALSQCTGQDAYGLHLTLLLTENSKKESEFSYYDTHVDFKCTRLGFVFDWSGATMDDMEDTDGDGDGGVTIYVHASAPYYGEPERETGSEPGDVMYDSDKVSADSEYGYDRVAFVVLDAG